MPQFVDELPKSSRGRSKKYDFSELYEKLLENGKAVKLTQGVDFKSKGPSMRQFIYKDTKERGLKAKIHTDESTEGKHTVTFTVQKAPVKDNGKPKTDEK